MVKRKSKAARRGVLLLLVLGILAMFGLVAITLVLIARHAQQTAQINQRIDQYADNPKEDLDQALMQVARGTDNPNSVIGPHSLLEDIYGSDTVSGNVGMWPAPSAPTDPPQSPIALCPGPLDGQLIEFTCGRTGPPTDGLQEVEARRRVGCVLTMLVGRAARQSTRVVGYRSIVASGVTYHRLQIVAFDGVSSAAVVGSAAYGTADPDFRINGAAFSGMGFGYNAGTPPLLSYQDDGVHPTALMPNPTALGYQGYLNSQPILANEDYDAPDYQNMLLAMLIPPIDTNNNGVYTDPIDTAMRVVAPSLHRPALINYWQNQATPPLPSRYILRAGVAVPPGYTPVDGPWDVDNDGDGVADSIWVDLGLPVRSMPDGRQYRPLFAILCTDLDGRLNLNAHGLVAQGNAGYYGTVDGSPLTYAGTPATSPTLPRGQGFGPAEVNLIPLFVENPSLAPDLSDITPGSEADKARIRYVTLMLGTAGIDGRYGEISVPFTMAQPYRAPGISLDTSGNPYNDPLSANQLFEFFAGFNYYDSVTSPATMRGAFGSPLDPQGTLALAIDLRGQPVYRPLLGWSSAAFAAPAVNDPYELDLSRPAGRGLANNAPADNPFTLAELERVLRPYDVDASMLPERLAALHPATEPSSMLVPTLASSINRRLEVTSDSWDLPSPNVAMTQEMRSSGGLGGIAHHVSDLLQAAGVTSAATMATLLPPDLLSGLRLDLNRPFGNGVDDAVGGAYNGVVDDPAEVWGEDVDRDGVLDAGEDLNGNGVLDGEQLSQFTAASAAYTVAFDAINSFDMNGDGNITGADRALARQLYARHLYVLLMVLVTNEDINGNGLLDPGEDANGNGNLDIWYPPGLDTTTPPFDATIAAAERARALAQFAVNVADFRDRDSIMTRFNYDVDPFDAGGWTPAPTDVVWGCERPELLMTETLAFHDRRTEDRDDDNGVGTRTDDATTPDPDFDTKYRPQGSLFVELFNPWTADEPRPAEFYYDYANSAWRNGVVLNQVVPGSTQPVWRLVVVFDDGAGALALDPDDPDPTKRPTIDRSVYFRDPSGLPAAVQASHGQAYYTTGAISPVANNGYALIGPRNLAGPDPLVTFLGFEQSQTTGNAGTTRNITLDPATVTAGSPHVVRNDDFPRPPAAQVDPPVLVPISQPRRLSITEPTGGYGLPTGASSYDPNTGQYDVTIDTPQDKTDQPGVWAVVKNGGTTASYAKIYLQRLANPLAPWVAETAAGANPYRTVDAMTVDLTSFNGVTNENNANAAPDGDEHNGSDGLNTMFHTLQRGEAEEPDNNLWKQELPHTTASIANDGATLSVTHYFNRTLRHSLGYLNLPFGTPRDNTIPGYKGASSETPTFPWFRWANRPFVSPMELTEVPASRSSLLLAVDPVNGYTVAPGFDMLPAANPYTNPSGPFPHLLNFFYSGATPPVTPPAGHFYRLFEYVEVPSPFVGTKIQGNPAVFAGAGGGVHAFHPPFNGISLYRDPGKINLNTVFSPLVWQGLMNRFPGFSLADFETRFLVSRRGYPYNAAQGGLDPGTVIDPAGEMAYINRDYPTLFANPFRSFDGNELVPLGGIGPSSGVNATLMRDSSPGGAATTPLFAVTSTTPHVDASRNPAFRYQDFQHLGNLLTTRSNVYAVWITVGYFEVDSLGNLGAEMGSDTGDIKRHRAFYIFDRSIPVGFQRGEDLNVQRAILLSRFIE